jgi:hypothetical protein
MALRLFAAAALTFPFYITPSGAVDAYRGGLMYENFCHYCHYRNVHFRPRARVRSLDDLAREIRLWQEVANLRWSNDDIADVQAYLNWLYYRFPYSATMPQQ